MLINAQEKSVQHFGQVLKKIETLTEYMIITFLMFFYQDILQHHGRKICIVKIELKYKIFSIYQSEIWMSR